MKLPPTDPTPGRAARHAKASPAAKAFSARLKQALGLEVEVLDFERRTLGREHVDRMNERRRARRERLDADADFVERGKQFSREPQVLPSAPAKDVRLPPELLALVYDVKRAYESTRATRALDKYIELNRSFLDSQNWQDRDAAVALREEIITREIAFTNLMAQARRVLAGEGTAEMAKEMKATLAEVAPQIAGTKEEPLALQIVTNPKEREATLIELAAYVRAHGDDGAGEDDDAAAWSPAEEPLAKLQTAVLVESGVFDLMMELGRLESELTALDERIEVAPTKQALEQRLEVLDQVQGLRAELHGTPPAKEPARRLLEVYPEAIRWQLEALGIGGALYERRLHELESRADSAIADDLPTHTTWETLTELELFLQETREAAPPPDPLADVDTQRPTISLDVLRQIALSAHMAKLRAADKAAKAAKAAGKPKAFPRKPKPRPRQKTKQKKPTPPLPKPPQRSSGGGGRRP